MPEPFLDQLLQLVARHPTANKWVVVPHHQLGWLWAERLVLSGCNWLNLRFITPVQLALQGKAHQLVEAGFHPCPEQLGPDWMLALLESQPDHPWFPLRRQPGCGPALWQHLCELRMAGVEVDAGYLQALEARGWLDRAALLTAPGPQVVTPQDIVVAYPYHLWSAVEWRFLNNLPAPLQPLAPSPVHPPRRWRELGRSQQAHNLSSQANLTFFTAPRRDLEFQEVLRRLPGPIDQAELVCREEDLPLLADVLAQWDTPATFWHGLPLGLSRTGQALLGLLDWIEGGFSAYRLRELLMANLVKGQPDSWTAARLLQQARVPRGRLAYAPRLQALRQQVAQRAEEWAREQERHLDALMGWLEQLWGWFPAQGSSAIWLAGMQQALQHILDRQPEATEAIDALLDSMKALEIADESLEQWCGRLRARVHHGRWGASRPGPGQLHVTSLELAGISGRPHVFITAQEEGREPEFFDSLLMSDSQRQSFPTLATSTDRAQEYAFAVNERWSCLEGQVTVSCSTTDWRDGQPQLPGWRFPQVDEPVQPWLDEEAERFRGNLTQVLDQFPWLRQGSRAAEARASQGFTAYDGHVPDFARLWKTLEGSRSLSCSRLEWLARCPYRFFLEVGLRLYGEVLTPDPEEQWLNPAELGHVLHHVFAAWADPRSPLADLESEMQAALAQQIPSPRASLRRQVEAELREHIRHFLALEGSRPPARVLAVEHPLQAHIQWAPGRVLILSGILDRLEETTDGAVRVVDHKTGRSFHPPAAHDYRGGTQLQHGLYPLLVSLAMAIPLSSLSFAYQCTHPAATLSWQEYPPPDSELMNVLRQLLDPIRSGAFVHTHRAEQDCTFCPHQQACTSRTDEQVEVKLEALPVRRQLLGLP